jgi:ATP citrate (pro-S)-lyase
MSEVMAEHTIGDVISLLWFKRLFPRWATKFIELVLVTAADHGPCVSGAHNTIVAARAGKDVITSLCSGLLTIGPRFGGAVDVAACNFKSALDAGTSAEDFVEDLKAKGQRVEGIGHRIKTAENRDKRVELLANYARDNFPTTTTFEYAKTVESYTLQKANNLVLNIDGTPACPLL